jgi:hypothetical protein
MKTEGIVSIWVGTTISLEEARDTIQYQYTEDGDLIESWFTEYFNVSYYDEDFVELLYNDGEAKTIEETLHGASYVRSHIGNATGAAREKGLEIINLAYLVFNFVYQGEIQTGHVPAIELTYIGAFAYNQKHHDN